LSPFPPVQPVALTPVRYTDLPMSTSNLKKRRGGIATENANSALGLATWRTNAINSRLTRLNKDRIQLVRTKDKIL
jgi:hypothetical protein